MNDKDPEQGTRHRRGWVSAVATIATFAALAATVFLAYPGPGAAGSSPLIPALLGASLDSHRDIETVRWRHRHRRDDDDSDDRRPAGANRLETTDVWSSNGAIRSINTESFGPILAVVADGVDPPA